MSVSLSLMKSSKVTDILPSVLAPVNKTAYCKKQVDPTLKNDNIGHWPDTVSKELRLRCKECSAKTATKCIKCNVFLCIMTNRNCFFTYHC